MSDATGGFRKSTPKNRKTRVKDDDEDRKDDVADSTARSSEGVARDGADGADDDAMDVEDNGESTPIFQRPRSSIGSSKIGSRLSFGGGASAGVGSASKLARSTPVSSPKPSTSASSTPKLTFAGEDEDGGEVIALKKSVASESLRKSGGGGGGGGGKLVVNVESLVSDLPKPMARSYGKSELQLLKSHARQLPPVDDVASRFSGRVGEPDSCNKDIPDASLIHAMKKKREMLREMGGSSAASFISLDVNDDDDDDEGANGGSTLVREEDELGDGEEAFEDHAGNRIVFGGDAVKKFRDQRRQLIREIIDDGEALENDEDRAGWEDEQIRRGAGVLSAGGNGMALAAKKKSGRKHNITKIPEAVPIPSFTEVEQGMRAALKRLEEQHSADMDQLAAVDSDLHNALASIEQQQELFKGASESYVFHQELRSFIDDLGGCMDDKMPEIVAIEEEYYTLFSNRAKVLSERRETGWSSDDEGDDEDLARFKSAYQSISDRAAHVMDDVRPEFKSIREVKDKMQSWKWSQAKSYNDSWASLSLKDLFRPFIRMELAGWLPLQGPNKELDQMEWCAALMDYGFRDSENQSGLQASDPDLNLIPTLIEKVLLPKLTQVVQAALDPFSFKQNKALANTLRNIDDFEVSHTKDTYKALSVAIFTSLERAVQRAVHQRLDLYAQVSAANVPQQQLDLTLGRILALHVRLFQSIFLYNGILEDDKIEHLAFKTLLLQSLIPSLYGVRSLGTPEVHRRGQAILSSAPPSWQARGSHFFQPLVQYLSKLV